MSDLPKLLFQAANLSDYLAQGFPLPLIYLYSALIGTNWLISLYHFQCCKVDANCFVIRMWLLFDLFFAVFAPFVVLAYAYLNFQLDRKVFQTREETLTPGSFSRIARLFAGPVEVAVLRLGFQNVQLLELSKVGMKSFLNVLGLHKHIEVNVATSDLECLPHDLFAKMDRMRFVRIGRAAKLTQLPSLTRLHRLSSLFLTGLYGLREFPSFDDFMKLSTLYIVDATHVQRLPSLKNLKNLKPPSLFRRNEMCCNGFLAGVCDLSNFKCLQRQGEPKVQCVSDRIPAQDLERITKADGFVCSTNTAVDLSDLDPTISSSGDACGGMLYRECFVGARRGMCFNSRLQVVMCDFMGEYETMRRLQIARKVGDQCGPDVEAWLGCVKGSL